MKSAVVVALSAAGLVSAEAIIGFDAIISEAPHFSTIKPAQSTTTDTASIAKSITAKLLSAHSSNKPLSTLSSQKPLDKTTSLPVRKTTKKNTTTKRRTTKKITTRKVKTTIKKKPKTPVKKNVKKTKSQKKPLKKKKKTTKKQAHKRAAGHHHEKRQAAASSTTSSSGSCASQSILYNYIPGTNTPTGFLTDTSLSGLSLNGLAPAGVTQQFSQQYGSLLANNYLGYYQLSSYNVSRCTALCTSYSSCTAFNIYFERDPVVDPGVGCRNPSAGVSVRCALWGSTISAAQATNIGEWRTDFMVVVQGSNGYTINTPPPAQTNFTGPVALTAAISVSSGSSYLTSSFQAGAYDVSFCAAACQATTQSNRNAAIAARTGTYAPCNYFNTFKVSSNGTLAGTYCKLYTDSSVASSANQYTQISGTGVSYDLTYSYSYSLTNKDNGTAPIPSPVSSTTSSTATATPAPANLVASCAQSAANGTFYDSNSILYKVKCGYDALGAGDIGMSYVDSFASCFAACDAKAGCSAFVYVSGASAGPCYFKALQSVTSMPNLSSGKDLAWLPGTYPYYESRS